MSKTQALAPLLVVLTLMLATASPVLAVTWQEVETWINPLNSILFVGQPELTSPDNDSTIYDNTPAFTWFTGANATHHRFWLDNDSDFSSPSVNILLGGTATTYTVTTALADDNYWWKVVATGGGLENSSENWTFELMTPVAKEWYDVEIWADFATSGVPGWLGDWGYRMKITIDHTKVDSDLIDFPVAVILTSANFDFSKARSDGYDIRFTLSNGTTLLKYERERHDQGNEKAEYHVKVPFVSSSFDTEFYIYYGKGDAADGAETVMWSARDGDATVIFDNKMWIVGGIGGTKRNDVWWSSDGVNWNQATAEAEWSAREKHGLVVFDDKMWVLGGYDGSNKNDVWWSSDGVNWTEGTVAEWSARREHTVLFFDNKVWILGGYTATYKNDVWWSSDLVDWTQATDDAEWSIRNGHTSLVFNNKMWVIGGETTGNNYLDDVWSSSDGENWYQATAHAAWSPREEHSSVVFGGKMWVFGGEIVYGGGEGSCGDDVWSSFTGADWTQVTSSAAWAPRTAHVSEVLDDKMWIMGGYSTILSVYYSDVWYSSNGGIWTQATTPGVWDSNFKLVTHMRDDPDTSHVRDSTSNSNDGTKKGANEPIENVGKIDNAQDFDGTDDYIDLPSGIVSATGPITVSFWFNADALPDANTYMINLFGDCKFIIGSRSDAQGGGGANKITFFYKLVTEDWKYLISDALSTGTWYYVTATFDPSAGGELFIDNVSVDSDATAQNLFIEADEQSTLGSSYVHAECYDGKLDEVRISNTIRNTSWIKTTFNNQSDPANFYTVGDEEIPVEMEWQEVETWGDFLKGEVEELAEVETWTDYVVSTEEWVPPGLSDEDIWAMFAIRIIFILGPLGFVAWNFTKIRDPETGLQTAGKVVICFIAIIVLWIVADAIQMMLASV